MKLAYIISAYKYPDQLVRLVKTLYSPNDYFLIHVDRKTSNDAFRRIHRGLSGLPNVHLLKRHDCAWGNFGHVQATLKAIQFLVKNRVDYEYAILLTGQDYPLMSNTEIHNRLAKAKGSSFMEYFPLPDPGWANSWQRVNNIHFWVHGRIVAVPRRPRPFPPAAKSVWQHGVQFLARTTSVPSLRLYGGSSYWCLSKDCVEYIDAYVKANPKYSKFFRRTHIPDEIFFQTILINSPLVSAIKNANVHYVDWTNPAERPAIIRTKAKDKLFSSGKLFGRKFDETIDSRILAILDERIKSSGAKPASV